MKDVVTYSMDYGLDNEVNPWGDFVTLLLVVTRERETPELHQREFFLVDRFGKRTPVQSPTLDKVLLSLFFQKAHRKEVVDGDRPATP